MEQDEEACLSLLFSGFTSVCRFFDHIYLCVSYTYPPQLCCLYYDKKGDINISLPFLCQSSNLYDLKKCACPLYHFYSKSAVNLNGKGIVHKVHDWKSEEMPQMGLVGNVFLTPGITLLVCLITTWSLHQDNWGQVGKQGRTFISQWTDKEGW